MKTNKKENKYSVRNKKRCFSLINFSYDKINFSQMKALNLWPYAGLLDLCSNKKMVTNTLSAPKYNQV